MARVAVVGSYGVGLTMRVPRLPVAGETLSGGEFMSGHGGKGSNQAVQAARLGAQVDFLTAIGADAMGESAQRLWVDEGISAHPVIVEDVATMAGMIIVEPSGENRIVIAAGALDHLAPHHVDEFRDELADADIVVVSLEIPVAVAVHALRLAHGAGTRTLLNPAPASALPDETWGSVDLLTPNATEAAILLGLDPADGAGAGAEDLARRLHDRTGATVLLTCGAEGVVVCQGDEITTVPAAPVTTVVDTTGAGDAFTAAAAVAIAEGADPIEAARFAARVGAHVVGHREVVPALPTRSQIEGTSSP
ncbi:MAG: ribokinase [Dermatophilaceae bacterium]|nr:ribokinase [Intrasporangiaceae bacterium]